MLTVLLLLAALLAVVAPARAAADADSLWIPRQYSVTTWDETTASIVGRINSITQSSDGYLWLGTADGLFRFDGAQFLRPKFDVDLLRGPIGAVRASRDGSVWVGFDSTDGIARIRGQHARIYTAQDGLTSGYVRALVEDREGAIWAVGFAGLSRYHDERWEHVGSQHGLVPQSAVQSVFEDRRGDLWVSTDAGIFRRPVGRPSFARHVGPSISTTSLRLLVSQQLFSEDAAGSILIVDPQRGVTRLDGADRLTTEAKRKLRGTVKLLLHDRRGNLWIGTSRGLALLRAHQPHADLEYFTRREGLPDDNIFTIFEDREGNIWVGTQGGLARLTESSFTSVISGVQLNDGVLARALTGTKDQSIWISRGEGLDRLVNGRWSHYGNAQGLPGNVTSLHSDHRGTLWVATDQGVLRFVGGRFQSEGIPLGRIVAMTTDHEGGLWMCEFARGIMRWKDGAVTPLDPAMSRRAALTAFTDSHGRVWIGLFDGGVLRYEDNRFQLYSSQDGLAAGAVNAIYESKDGAIWVGTRAGISKFDNGRFITPREFSSIRMWSILEDGLGYMWVGSSAGLIRFNKADVRAPGAPSPPPSIPMRFALYTKSDGVPAQPARGNWPSAAHGAGDSLWFTTRQGLTVVNPQLVSVRSPAPPKVRIEGVTIDNQTSDSTPGMRLRPLTSSITIEYGALSLWGSEKVRFRYKLDGIDPDWVNAGTQKTATYRRLPVDSYRFRVSAHYDGAPEESSAVWAFTQAPTWYQTRWFLVSCIASAVLALAAAWRIRLGLVHKRFSIVFAERERLSRDIHDTLLQGLVGSVVQLDAISRQMETDPRSAQDRLGRTRRQLLQYITETRESIHDLRSSLLEKRSLASALRDVGQELTRDTPITFQLNVIGDPVPHELLDGHLLRIAREAIGNAVRHGRPGRVTVQLRYVDGTVALRVSDDGCGFDPIDARAQNAGWGLITMRERAQQIGGTLVLDSRHDNGTQVDVVAPVSKRDVA